MKKRLLFVASLPKNGHGFDGETNKSQTIYNCLKDVGQYRIDVVDYTKNKYFQTIRLIFLSFFRKYDLTFISKCIVGGSIALHQVVTFGRKSNRHNIVFYVIGNGYKGFEKKKMNLADIKQCRKVILESEKVIAQMKSIGIETDLIFPCIKEEFSYPFLPKTYDANDVLDVLYFSRIHEKKGVLDAIQAIINVNERLKRTAYKLTVSGGKSFEPEYQECEDKIKSIAKCHPEIIYVGTDLNLKNADSYLEIQKYDLHIFPSRFDQECAPGSIIDMFIAGVPTLSSDFESAKCIMSDKNSYFFKMNDTNDLEEKLIYIFNHKDELAEKRLASYKEKEKYTTSAFVSFLKTNDVL